MAQKGEGARAAASPAGAVLCGEGFGLYGVEDSELSSSIASSYNIYGLYNIPLSYYYILLYTMICHNRLEYTTTYYIG